MKMWLVINPKYTENEGITIYLSLFIYHYYISDYAQSNDR